MNVGRRCLAAVLVLATSSCVLPYTSSVEVRRRPHEGSPKLRPDLFVGTHALRDDGSLRFDFKSDKLCQRERRADERTITTTQRKFSAGGIILLISAISAIPIGTGLLITSGGDDPNSTVEPREADKIVAGTLLAFGGIITAIMLGALRGGRANRPDITESPWKTVSLGSDPERCSTDLLEEVLLATPWGTTVRGRLDAKVGATASVSFAVDWNVSDSINPATPVGRAQLAGPWKLQVPKQDPNTTFTLTEAEVGRAAEHVTRSRERTIAGATPADLSTTGLVPAGGSVVVGERSSLSLTIENRGATTAKTVTVTTRSSVLQLHDLKLVFGTIQPKKRVTQTIAVTLPATVTGDTATVVLVFSEASGQVPADVAQQLKLTRSLCAGKRLTRPEYDKKRANLQKAVNDGSMSQDDFNRYDAELVRCLE